MGLRDVTDRDAVLDAIDEFDDLGRAAFLTKYGFGPARQYALEYLNKQYDSKAIVGAAHRFQHGRALGSDEFSGGEATVQTLLEGLGFRVTRSREAPDTPTATRPAARGAFDQQADATWSLRSGEVTTRAAISGAYGGSTFGGIEPSRRTPNVVICTDPKAGEINGYDFDGWNEHEGGVYYYTGEGRVGDQLMVKGNKGILEHFESARTIRLFEAIDGPSTPGGKPQRYVRSLPR